MQELCMQIIRVKNYFFQGSVSMKVAVSYNNGLVAKRFGETEVFKIYEIKRGRLINSYILETGELRGEALAPFLYDNNIDVVFCNGIGKASRKALAKESIIFFPGVVGKADYQIDAFIKGDLSFNALLNTGSSEEE